MIDAIEHIAENMVRITKTSMLSGQQSCMDFLFAKVTLTVGLVVPSFRMQCRILMPINVSS